MISAFKHIRLSGYNLLPQSVDGATRLTLNSSGVAYYSELTGVSGYLENLIVTTNTGVSSLNGLQNAVNITGRDGIQIFIEGQDIVVSGNDAAVQSLITNLTNDLFTTGSTLNTKIDTLSGYSNSTFATITNLASTGSNLQGQINSLSGDFVAFTGNLDANFASEADLAAASGVLAASTAATGSTLNIKIDNLSGYADNTFATITNLAATGSTLSNSIAALSGTLTGEYVQKATQQQFIVDLPSSIESTGVTFPLVFASTPNSVQVTFEPSTDVGYMVVVKNRSTTGFTAEFSDVLSETGNKLNVFASI